VQRQEWRVLMREQDYAAAVPSFPLHFAQTVFTRTCTAQLRVAVRHTK
jgi:hypothetical protein